MNGGNELPPPDPIVDDESMPISVHVPNEGLDATVPPPPEPTSSSKATTSAANATAPAVPVPPQYQHPQHQPQHQQQIQQRTAQPMMEGNVFAPLVDGTNTHADVFIVLLDKELSIEMYELELSEYLSIILMHLIKNQPCEARLASLRAIQKHGKLPPLLTVAMIAHYVSERELSSALHHLHKFALHQTFGPYIEELNHRLTSQRLRQIERAYETISFSDLTQMLGFEAANQEVNDIIAATDWRIDERAFVHPATTEKCLKFFGDETYNVRAFGAWTRRNEKADNVAALNGTTTLSDPLQHLVAYAELLDRV